MKNFSCKFRQTEHKTLLIKIKIIFLDLKYYTILLFLSEAGKAGKTIAQKQ